MSDQKTRRISLAEHVAETHRNAARVGTVVTGDNVSGDVVNEEESEQKDNESPEASEEEEA